MKKKAIISSIITVLCIVAAVVLRIAMDKVDVEYTEVKATVVSSEERVRRVYGKSQKYYEVVVEYEAGNTSCRMFITVIPTCLAGRQQRICMMASCMRTLRELPAPPRWLRFISCFFSHLLVW